MKKLMTVVRVKIGQSRMVVGVLSDRFSFAVWKEWFKRKQLLPGDEVVGEGSSYMIVRSHTGSLLSYDVTQTILDPHMDESDEKRNCTPVHSVDGGMRTA